MSFEQHESKDDDDRRKANYRRLDWTDQI